MLYVIAGPTASGKTAVAIELAKLTGGEIISADSMQVYRGMDIGTAKPSREEMAAAPHHLIDVVRPNEPFSVAEYAGLAAAAIEDVFRRGKTPIVAGGTGFYINALIYGADFTPEEDDTALRQELMQAAREQGAAFLHGQLWEKDPAAAAAVHPNNIKRVARALSFCINTGGLFSEYNAGQRGRPLRYDTRFFTLDMQREVLYSRVDRRTHVMWEADLPAEVQRLLDEGYDPGLAPMQGIGYKETVGFLRGEITQAETIAAIQQATRNYAKRQLTWFRHQARDAVLLEVRGRSAKELAGLILGHGLG
ncbi:MAG: tRNA (adenosine(37)-N6)-dimethylallyltransferase MiaA [Defluviitaleaceae bacterium]|nr:tRNA (adenosine(37)-N6)-dimethylallyltransferase MiaA [Defluviitaleaceae bacterium]